MIDRVAAWLFFLGFLGYGYYAQDIQIDYFSEGEIFTPRSLPNLIAICGASLSLLLALLPVTANQTSEPDRTPLDGWFPAMGLVALMMAYGLVLEPVGFIATTIGFLIIAMIILGEHRWLRLILCSVPIVVGFYFIMSFLGIYLEPAPWLGDLFG